MNNIFSGCISLNSLPDISKWNTNNITNMCNIFNGCKSLRSLPDISKWNTNNVTNMNNIFSGCDSLTSFPDSLNSIGVNPLEMPNVLMPGMMGGTL